MASTQHELAIRAYVKDQATPALNKLRQEVEKTTGAQGRATSATVQQSRQTAILSGAVGGLASRLVPAVAGIVGLHQVMRIATDGMRALIEESLRMIRVSAEVEEAQSALAFVFGDMAEQQERFIGTQAALTGRFSNDLRQFQVELVGIVKPLGIADERLGAFANTLTEVGIDLASFFNKDDADVFAKIIQGISGETEGMRRLGVDLREAAVQARAFQEGLDPDRLTEAEKAMIRLALIVERSGDKLGDAVRTADSFTNSMRRIQSQIEETRAKLGEELQGEILQTIEAFGGMENVLAGIVFGLNLVAEAAKQSLALVRFLAEQTANIPGLGALGESVLPGLDRRFAEIQGEILLSQASGLFGAGELGAAINKAATEGIAEGLGDTALQQKINAALRDMIRNGLNLKTDDRARITDDLAGLLGSISQDAAASIPKVTSEESADAFRAERLRLEGQIERSLDEQIAKVLDEAQTYREHVIPALKHKHDLTTSEARLLASLNEELRDQAVAALEAAKAQEQAAIAAEKQRAAQEAITAEIEANRGKLELMRGAAGDIAGAFADAAFGVEDAFQRAFENIIRNIIRAQAEALILKGLFGAVTGSGLLTAGAFNQFFGTTFSAKGNVFQGGNVVPFAGGGLIQQPIAFPMHGGRVGIAGEAGTEGILPLARDSRGRLGVHAQGGGGGGDGGTTFGPGSIVIVQQPGESGEQLALKVALAIQSKNSIKSAFRGAMGGGIG